MRLLVTSIMLFLNILQDEQQYFEVAAVHVTGNSSVEVGGDNLTASNETVSSSVEEGGSGNNSSNSSNSSHSCDCSCGNKEERSLTVGGGLGLAAGTAILIFAFSNTVIIAATLVITYILYHVLITAVAILAPGLASVMAKFLAVFTF